ncbi:hypothetical protein [Intestinibacillus massiliensis]|uniref:hypothetical protein n=1 Tax=Intestinibacillus massiliensis TaxID=1871029 RepID=UPI000B34AA6D|nr:hypothetical protein [Intestinibacillus massiliensis]
MDRLTNDNPQGNFETMLNYVFGKDGYAYIRSDGESDEPVLLTEWARKQCLERHCDVAPDGTPDDVDQSICDCAFYRPECPIFLAYTFACQAVHMRDRCKAYEDAIPFPDLLRAAELVKADDKGLCVVLPCKVGSTVYTIFENYFECENCEHKNETQYNKIVGRMCCALTGGRHCPYQIKEHVVEGFEVGQNEETGKLFLSAPGMWGCEGLEPFVGVDGRWYPTHAEAEAALADK